MEADSSEDWTRQNHPITPLNAKSSFLENMDPLSVAANVVAVVEGLSMTIKLLRKIVALKNAPNEVFELMNELSTLQAMLRAVAIAIESFKSPLSPLMQDCLAAIDSIRTEAARVIARLSAALPSNPDQSAQMLDKEYEERREPKISFGTALKAVFMNGKKLQELRAQIRGISTSLSAALIAANSIQINEMQSWSPSTVQLMFQAGSLSDDYQLKLEPSSTNIGYLLRQMNPEESNLSTRKVENDSTDTAENSKSEVHKPQNPKAATSNSFYFSASLVSESCRSFCPCQCHKTTVLRSPSWFNILFGSVIFSTNTALSLSRRHCDMPRTCKRSGRLSVQFAYFAPLWVMARAFCVLMSRAGIGGINADLAFRAPRVRPMGSRIFYCIFNGSIESVRDMLVTGEASLYDVDDCGGLSLLCNAIAAGQVQICKLLLSLGADRMSCRPDGTRSYMTAVNHYILEPPQLYVDNGENIASEMRALFWDEETQNDLDLSPLHQAFLPEAGPLGESHIQLLVAHLNSRNATGATPLMWAACRGDTKSLKLLLKYGADPNIQCRCLATVLHYAALYGSKADVELLLEYGASPFATDRQGGQPLHWAVDSSRYGKDPLGKIEALIQHGADVNAVGPDGKTPIWWLLTRKIPHLTAVRIARYLIEAGADMDGGVSGEPRFAEYAVLSNNVPLVQYLLDIGAEIRLRPPGKSNGTLHMAAMTGNTEMWGLLKTLVDQGVFPDLEASLADSEGYTPWNSFENWRYQYGYSDRKHYDAERGKFGELMEAVDRAILRKPVNLFPPPRRDAPTKVVE